MGEASKGIPAETRAKYDAIIDWQKVTGFRNIAIHAYFAVDVAIVWTIATQRLGELKSVVRQMLDDIQEQQNN